MSAFRLFEYLIRFWSYQACDYTVTKPRTWPTCWSSSDENRLSSHGDIHPAIQTFILLVTMEPASLLACYSAIAADHDYTLLEGQPLSQLPDTPWYIPSHLAPPIPFVLGQRVYKYCLLPPMYIGYFWQSANASSQSPASKLFLRRPYLSIVLSLFASVSPCQVPESCRSPVQV